MLSKQAINNEIKKVTLTNQFNNRRIHYSIAYLVLSVICAKQEKKTKTALNFTDQLFKAIIFIILHNAIRCRNRRTCFNAVVILTTVIVGSILPFRCSGPETIVHCLTRSLGTTEGQKSVTNNCSEVYFIGLSSPVGTFQKGKMHGVFVKFAIKQ